MEAVAKIDGKLKGELLFTQSRPGALVHIRGRICGWSTEDIGEHGMHVHEGNTLPRPGEEWEGPLCCGKGLGAHFNPYKRQHGGPQDQERHVGDLGNILVKKLCKDCKTWCSEVNIKDSVITLDRSSPACILDRGMVIHSGRDDLGRGGNKESLKTGNAGSRIGWGIIRSTK